MNTIVRNVHNVPAEALALRQQVREHVASLQKALAEVETRWMQLADAFYEIQLKGYWRLYSDAKGARYLTFEAWIDAECGQAQHGFQRSQGPTNPRRKAGPEHHPKTWEIQMLRTGQGR